MRINIKLKTSLIAPCGMNCGLCLGYQRVKNHCPGCNFVSPDKPNYCLHCIIKNCEYFSKNNAKYCYNCDKYPCKRMKQLDKRYRTRYGMSMIENLNTIKSQGIRKFVASEKQKWTCEKCGNIICVHRPNCPVCGAERMIQKYD